MHADFQLTCVAFARSTGGRVRLLLAVDRGEEQLFDGEPVLLVDHRPGSRHEQLELTGPDAMEPAIVQQVHAAAALQLAALVDAAFDETGSFDGQRILGTGPTVALPAGLFATEA
ncbi:MAG: hypothetical protein KDC46_13930 [Thermoleophilia bacterium]|nr:hypothetical protein [Thermoleophilia bacterium]